MITGELKNKIDSLWDIFASGGLVNPLDVIEQITYLMFIRDLDDFDNKELYDMCKNYKELDTSDELNSIIYNLCSDLEECGEYEAFMNKFSFDEEEK